MYSIPTLCGQSFSAMPSVLKSRSLMHQLSWRNACSKAGANIDMPADWIFMHTQTCSTFAAPAFCRNQSTMMSGRGRLLRSADDEPIVLVTILITTST
jgi:hypothetical protein